MANIIRYNNASNVLKLIYPPEWNVEDLTAVTITVKDLLGNTLLDADTVTLQAVATLESAVSRYDTSIDTDYTGSFDAGQMIKLVGSVGSEIKRIKGWDSSTKLIELETIVDNPYDAGDSVYSLQCEYTLDTTDTDSYQKTGEYKVVWSPVGTGNDAPDIYQILPESLQISGFVLSLKSIYPRVYDALINPVNRVDEFIDAAEERLYIDLMADGLDMYALKEQRLLKPVLMACVAHLWSLSGDKALEDEKRELKVDYSSRLSSLKKLPVWIDMNADDIMDDNEVQDHEPKFYERVW